MPENYEVYIKKYNGNLPVGEEESVKVRFIGFIDEQECEAVMNVENAFRKLSTAANENLSDFRDTYRKRFVLVISRPSKSFGEKTPNVFISSPVESVAYMQGQREFKCKEKYGSRKFRFVPIS